MKKIPKELEYLAEEARKYDSAEEFAKAFTLEIKHGRYWHVTQNPDFKIDPELGPRDMSSMATGDMEKGKLMITSDLEYWTDEYAMGAEEYDATPREYVAEIDMSEVPKQAYWQVHRGFGNEFYVDDPSKAKVIKVILVEEAIKESEEYQEILESNIANEEDLTDFYNQAIKETEIPPIRKPSLEYEVELINSKVLKCPKRGFGFKVKTDYNVLKNLGNLAPQTEYDEKRNCLIQEAVKGRFATEDELEQVCDLIREKGYIPRGLLPHDVIITPEGKFKVVDVGHFEKTKETSEEERESIKKEIAVATIKRECLTDNERCEIAKEILKELF